MASSGRTCYNRDGSRITDGAYLPCSNSTSHDSACCGTNHQGVGQTKVADDVCETNGLCQNYEAFDGTNEGVKLWWRQGCTDSTWKSPYCLPDVCNSGVWKSQNAPVRQCSDNSWCCGEKTCCSVSSSIFRLAATVGPTATPSSSVAPLSSGSSSVTAPSTPGAFQSATASAGGTSTSSPEPKSGGSTGLSTGAKAGIAVAIVVVVILLGIIAFLLLKLKKRKKAEGKDLAEVSGQASQEKPQSVVYAHEAAPAHPVELDGESRVVEIGDDHATELPNDQRLELPDHQRLELPERGSTVGRGGAR